MFTNNKIVTTTLIALSLSMGLSACSPAQNDAAPATASATASPSASEAAPTESSSTSSETAVDSAQTAEAANDRINDFMAAIASDVSTATDSTGPNAAPDAPAMTNESFQKDYAYSLSFIDQTQFSEYKVGQIIGGFASIYMKDPEATIISKDTESMIVSGDTATIEGNAFTVTMNGVEKKGSSGSGGAMVLTFADGEWKITGWVDGPSSK